MHFLLIKTNKPVGHPTGLLNEYKFILEISSVLTGK